MTRYAHAEEFFAEVRNAWIPRVQDGRISLTFVRRFAPAAVEYLLRDGWYRLARDPFVNQGTGLFPSFPFRSKVEPDGREKFEQLDAAREELEDSRETLNRCAREHSENRPWLDVLLVPGDSALGSKHHLQLASQALIVIKRALSPDFVRTLTGRGQANGASAGQQVTFRHVLMLHTSELLDIHFHQDRTQVAHILVLISLLDVILSDMEVNAIRSLDDACHRWPTAWDAFLYDHGILALPSSKPRPDKGMGRTVMPYQRRC